ncbi:MAG TPA: exosortase/archaeosortase family protein [Planctomycetota bacterium]|nr:exosortase/archaeosortase family protein [Planctomycetota bacterium]
MHLTSTQRIHYGIIGVLTILMFVMFFPVMWKKWFESDSYYSHGLLIPIVSAYLIYRMRDQLAELEPQQEWIGLPVLLFGVFMRVFSAFMEVNFLAGFSLVIVLGGLSLLLLGRKITWKLLFPILFLVSMIPLSQISITKISYELKTFAAEMAARILPHIGVPVDKLGSELSWIKPTSSLVNPVTDRLVIDDVCSGLRSMIALLAFGAVFAYISPTGPRRRLELFAASIPCSVIANMTRIVIITLVAYLWGSQAATVNEYIPNPFASADADGIKHGFTIHDATGILIFVVAFIGFFTYEKLLNRPPFRLPRPRGPRKWIHDVAGRLVRLTENQLECIVRSGHLAPDHQLRPEGSPHWQKASTLPQFAASPRNRRLKCQRLGREFSFDECIRMVKTGEIRKHDLLSFAESGVMMRASSIDFIRSFWPADAARVAWFVVLYAALPIALFLLVRSDPGLGSLAEGKPGAVLVTVVLWFAVRTVMLASYAFLLHHQPAENPMPAGEEDGKREAEMMG